MLLILIGKFSNGFTKVWIVSKDLFGSQSGQQNEEKNYTDEQKAADKREQQNLTCIISELIQYSRYNALFR